MRLPILPWGEMVAGLTESETWIIMACKGRGGRLRTNKPFRAVTARREGCANYVWRMMCFDLAGFGKHSCMPVCADFDLDAAVEVSDGCRYRYNEPGYAGQRDSRKALRVAMDDLTNRAESVLPPGSMKGVLQWGRAMGLA